jgi:hypothetical protein
VKLTNLVENPSFEAGDVGYVVDAGLTGLVVNDVTYLETASLRVTGGAGSSKTLYILKFDGTRMPVTANEFYAFSLHVKPDPANGATIISGRPVIEWRDSGGGVISTTLGTVASFPATDEWRRVDVGGVAPATAVTARPGWRETAFWAVGKILYFDGVMFNQGSLVDYIDGSQPGCVWTGTAHESTSTRGIKVVYDNPPSKIADWPCFVIFPPALEIPNRLSAGREKEYRVRLLLIGSDEELASIAGWIDAMREEVVDAFDDNVTLDGGATQAYISDVAAAAGFEYGGVTFSGIEHFLRVELKETYNYQP